MQHTLKVKHARWNKDPGGSQRLYFLNCIDGNKCIWHARRHERLHHMLDNCNSRQRKQAARPVSVSWSVKLQNELHPSTNGLINCPAMSFYIAMSSTFNTDTVITILFIEYISKLKPDNPRRACSWADYFCTKMWGQRIKWVKSQTHLPHCQCQQ